MTKLVVLTEGQYSVDQSKKFIPFDPAFHDPKDRPASIFVHVQPFLLQTEQDLILFDTGLGYHNEQGELVIHKAIQNAGFDPNEVTKVLMSHLHFDHAGGMVYEKDGSMQLSFPNAYYYIQKEELNFALTHATQSYRLAPLEYLRRSDALVLLDGAGSIDGYIDYEITGGHCPFHQVFKLHTSDGIYFYGGDVLPEAMQVIRRFIAKYDFDGRKCMELRNQFAAQAVVENWKCLMYHDQKNAITSFEIIEDAISIKKPF
jgi:glyoxylase-like metal-dependent hydrolase (beta-lactamase superfamily II)